jgi:hypothetical protein
MMDIEIVRAGAKHEAVWAICCSCTLTTSVSFTIWISGPDWRFVYKELPLYFRESNRHAFLVRKDGMWAGFILVHRGSANLRR